MTFKKRFVKLKIRGGQSQKAEHIKLVVGKITTNPHPKVQCPYIMKGYRCHQKHRPQLLTNNMENEKLQLWSCAGTKFCAKKPFLIRVEYE